MFFFYPPKYILRGSLTSLIPPLKKGPTRKLYSRLPKHHSQLREGGMEIEEGLLIDNWVMSLTQTLWTQWCHRCNHAGTTQIHHTNTPRLFSGLKIGPPCEQKKRKTSIELSATKKQQVNSTRMSRWKLGSMVSKWAITYL